MQQIGLIILCGGIGVLVTLQAAANSQLAQSLEQPLWAAAVASTVGLVVIFGVLLVTRTPAPTSTSLEGLPLWAWFGGLGGAAFVAATGFLVPRIGAAGFLVATIAGQLIAAVILDHRGWLGLPPSPADARRIIGLILVLVGVLLVAVSKKAPNMDVATAVNAMSVTQQDKYRI